MKSDTKDFHFRVIIKFHDFLRLPSYEENEESHRFSTCDTLSGQQLRQMIPGKDINKLFTSLSPERIIELRSKAMKSDPTYHPPNFLNYYSVSCDNEAEAKEIVEMLRKQDVVELSYIETHSACPPSVNASPNPLSFDQEYLNPAPLGIDARYAWEFCGGDGDGHIKFIDIEQGWILNHEDLKVSQLPCTGLNHYEHEDHGAGVLGVIMMQDNTKGGVGITPKANGYVISQWRPDGGFNTADAIMAALDHLNFGDILLLETQAFDILQTKKIWPVEIHEANFQLIRLATTLGIVVVEAAGNDKYATGNDLDFFSDNNARHVFNRSSAFFKDSGAIIVAAAASKVSHTRINYSNYGNRIDCFAWGENVVTAGNSPGSSGLSVNTYSGRFCGTSSASAIITGAAIAVQSIIEAKYGFRISPMQMRNILSNELYGTHSENGHQIDKIGVMPDLKKIIDQALDSISLINKKFDKRIQNKKLQTPAIDSL